MEEKQSCPKFQGGSIEDSDLSGAILRNASFEGVLMYSTDLSCSDLSGSTLYLVLAHGANFRGANLQRVQFLGGSYKDVDFRDADLRNAIFDADNMGGYVDLSGADLSSAKIEGTTFLSIHYSDSTRFPAGFIPNPIGLKHE